MARTNIVATAPIGAYPTAAQISGDAMVPGLTSTSDPTDRYTALIDGKTLVIAHNTDSVPHIITFTSAVDASNRTQDIAQILEAGEIGVFGPFKALGWGSVGAGPPAAGSLLIDVASALIQIAVLTLP